MRMFRAAAFAARLGFRLDPPVVDAMRSHRQLIATASPARLIEEYYKVLRSGAAEQTFRLLAEHGLLEPITPELHHSAGEEAMWQALADSIGTGAIRLDPEGLTNAVLLGTLLVPLGLMPRRRGSDRRRRWAIDRDDGDAETTQMTPMRRVAVDLAGAGRGGRRKSRRFGSVFCRWPGATPSGCGRFSSVQRRLMDLESSPRAKRALMHRGPFQEALVWLEIHGRALEALEHWRGFIEASGGLTARSRGRRCRRSRATADGARRRRRRGRRRGAAASIATRPK